MADQLTIPAATLDADGAPHTTPTSDAPPADQVKLPPIVGRTPPPRGPSKMAAVAAKAKAANQTSGAAAISVSEASVEPPGCGYEATCLLAVLRDMLVAANVIAFLEQFVLHYDAILGAERKVNVVRKLAEPLAPYLTLLNERCRRGAALRSDGGAPQGRLVPAVRHVLRFARHLWREDLEFRVTVMVKSRQGSRLSALSAALRDYVRWADGHLRVDAALDERRAVQLRRARHQAAKHEGQIAALRTQIAEVESVGQAEIKKKEAKIEKLRAYKEEIVTAIVQLSDQARKESEERVRANDSRSSRLAAQMHFQMEQLKFRLNVLEHINDETEARLRKERKEVIELVSKCLIRKDASLRLKKEVATSVEQEYEKERDSLDSLKSRIQEVEDEFKQIVLERENQVKQHRARVQKVKKQFQAVVRIHSFFSKTGKKVAPPPPTANDSTAAPSNNKTGKKESTKRKGKPKAQSANQ